MSPSEFTVVRHLMDQLAAELALGRDLQRRLASMSAGRRRNVLEQYLAETLGHAERVRNRLLALGESDQRAGWGSRLAAAVAGRTRALASASAVRLAGAGGNARILDDAMDDCAAVAREIAAYVALARLARLADDVRTADLAAAHLADEERMLQRLLAEVSDLAEALVPDVPDTAAAVPARREETGDEPWVGYDALSVADVRSALDGASREQLDSVHDYERDHKHRDSVLKAAAR